MRATPCRASRNGTANKPGRRSRRAGVIGLAAPYVGTSRVSTAALERIYPLSFILRRGPKCLVGVFKASRIAASLSRPSITNHIPADSCRPTHTARATTSAVRRHRRSPCSPLRHFLISSRWSQKQKHRNICISLRARSLSDRERRSRSSGRTTHRPSVRQARRLPAK